MFISMRRRKSTHRLWPLNRKVLPEPGVQAQELPLYYIEKQGNIQLGPHRKTVDAAL
jgi:hypothetical protein